MLKNIPVLTSVTTYTGCLNAGSSFVKVKTSHTFDAVGDQGKHIAKVFRKKTNLETLFFQPLGTMVPEKYAQFLKTVI